MKWPPNYRKIGQEIGELVAKKNLAYGDAFNRVGDVMRILYPSGISLEQMDDALPLARIVDKLLRIANDRDAFGENPYEDIAGYGILGAGRERKTK